MPRNADDLSLPEQILLLALRDDRGTIEFKASMYSYALGGAILGELLLAGRIRIAEDKKKRVDAVETKPLGDPVLDECLGAIATAKRPRGAEAWVSRFAGIRKLKHRIAAGLCRKGVLNDSEDQILLIFTRKVYPAIDPRPESHLVERMREVIFGEGESLDPRVVLVVALAHAVEMLPIHFPKKELRARKTRLERIVKGDLIGGPTRAAVQAVQAAHAAVMVCVVAAAASSHAGH